MFASPSGKEVPEPERYTLEKKKSPWYYWIIPSKYDPKNAFIANWAAWIVALEGLAIFGYSVTSPTVCGVSEPGYISAVVVPSIFGILACWAIAAWYPVTCGRLAAPCFSSRMAHFSSSLSSPISSSG